MSAATPVIMQGSFDLNGHGMLLDKRSFLYAVLWKLDRRRGHFNLKYIAHRHYLDLAAKVNYQMLCIQGFLDFVHHYMGIFVGYLAWEYIMLFSPIHKFHNHINAYIIGHVSTCIFNHFYLLIFIHNLLTLMFYPFNFFSRNDQ
jgi:hypothetical protein